MAPPRALDPAPAPPPDLGDAVRFVMTVKREFAGEPDKYEEFLAVLRESQSMGTAAVVDRVKVLLGGRHDLIRGFNKFVPRGYEMGDQQQEAAAHIRAAL
uniref:Histone deacetylase interacting domain-containing protein n=1 Tax=Setaria viridis TaxID=4556 RepID=A0A4U6U0J4_SETVI|nr:paired amphipathic helix protein Sin3-like 6 [Setaria viridis]TKW08262.1 hypothetical protein SEVIR_6G018100v2 [Setaria viridis]